MLRILSLCAAAASRSAFRGGDRADSIIYLEHFPISLNQSCHCPVEELAALAASSS